MKFWMPATLLTAMATTAFALPKATEVYQSMGFGTNIGNTMEAPSDPTSWGNTIPTAEYIKAIKDAGFGTVRIPTAWDSHATDGTISSDWLAEVKKVVDLCINEGLYVILNSHWDNGWLEDEVFDGEHPDRNNSLVTTDKSKIAQLQENYWKQIADYFKSYDEHLIFASANEPGVNDPRNYGTAYEALDATWKAKYTDNGQYAFDTARAAILKEYHEACLKAVRESGGNNATRTVVVQMPRTEIDDYKLLADYYPTDPAGTGYTMAEAHYYPYQLTLMEEDADWGNVFLYWEDLTPGDDAAHTATGESKLGSKAHIEKQFGLLKSAFVDQGIPVVIGEMGSIKRIDELSGNSLKWHLLSRAGWYGYVAQIAKADGIVPIIWDTGAEDNHNMTIIRRQQETVGDIIDYEVLNALRSAYGLDTLAGNSIDSLVAASVDSTNKAAVITYVSTRTDSSETGTMRINVGGKDWSEYVGIQFSVDIYGTVGSVTSSEYGWASVDFFVMSGSSWSWNDYNLIGAEDIPKTNPHKFTTYTLKFADLKTKGEVTGMKDVSNVMAIGLNIYGTQFNGVMAIDDVLLLKADGTADTLESFARNKPEIEGTAVKVELKSATDAAALRTTKRLSSTGLHFSAEHGMLHASFTAVNSGRASVALVNSKGQIVSLKVLNAVPGTNSVSLETNYRGAGFLILKQNSGRTAIPVRLK